MTSDFLAPSAEADLYEAVTWLARENATAADGPREAALRSMRRIVARPLLGRLRPALAPPPYRFWRIANFPYLIVDNAARRPPLLLRVLHMSRDLPALLAGVADLAEREPPPHSPSAGPGHGGGHSHVPDLGRSARRKPAAGTRADSAGIRPRRVNRLMARGFSPPPLPAPAVLRVTLLRPDARAQRARGCRIVATGVLLGVRLENGHFQESRNRVRA